MARLRRTRSSVNGFLNVHKPAGVTSHYCVAVVRKIFNTTEVGHAGTLDPMATGVMVMALGRATKFMQFLKSDKEYRGVVRFGLTTSTDDITGEKLAERPAPWLTEQLIQTRLQAFVGTIDQIPPKVSALKVDGKRLYELARDNVAFEVKSRRVDVHGIDLLDFVAGDFPEATVHVACGAGTYIRSIARECGENILMPSGLESGASSEPPMNLQGQPCVGATLVSLERTRSGAFAIDQSRTFDQVRALLDAGESPVHSIDSAVQHVPLLALSKADVLRWIKGGEVQIDANQIQPTSESHANAVATHVRVYDSTDDQFLGVSHVDHLPPPVSSLILRRRSFAADFDYMREASLDAADK